MVTVAAASQNMERMGQRQGGCGLHRVGLSPRLLQSVVNMTLAAWWMTPIFLSSQCRRGEEGRCPAGYLGLAPHAGMGMFMSHDVDLLL